MTTNSKKDSTNLILYFIIAILFSTLFWIPGILKTQGIAYPGFLDFFSYLPTFGPLVTALILIAINDGKKGVKSLFRKAWDWKFRKIWILFIFLIAILLPFVSLLIKNLIEKESFILGSSLAMAPLIAVIILLTGGPLEEFGWRGYALPLLQRKFNALISSLILGTVWALWHLPLHFISTTVQYHIPIYEFAAVTIIGAILYTWIYNGTGGSLSAVILFHWMGNLFGGALFMYYTATSGRWIFFGLQLILVLVIIKIYGYRKLGKEKVLV
jgi:membrane protease YdiL (CAAX protease family)